MKKSLAEKWVDALRGGKFKQGRETLYDKEKDSYCCLGILDKINGSREIFKGTLETTYVGLGLRDRFGGFTVYGSEDCCIDLAELNDKGLNYLQTSIDEFINIPFTFDEIADLVQIEYIEGL